ncbi:MAG: hypothetical protein GKR94_09540 [Gammaproteobacteria bacterium]|nr:hypothetical protein [Gammaproteobacteria bacterium]
MGEVFEFLLQRQLIIALAIGGALIVLTASYLMKREGRAVRQAAMWVERVGYGLTAASVALFIIAGFRA